MGASGDNRTTKDEISFRCTYDIKDINDYIQIINDRYFLYDKINNEIKSKIKILNGNKKEEIIFNKKFNQIGINTIDFIIEGKLTNTSFMFLDCLSLKKIEFFSFDTSKVTDMRRMFQGCIELENLDLSNFNTSKVIYINGMFYECRKLEYLDLSNFNTSKVEHMREMFRECSKLKEIKGINNFNTSNVECMASMFQKCRQLEYLDLSNFITSKVNIMYSMFNGCIELEYLNLSNFNTSKVEHMENMFRECSKLKEIKGITNFKISKKTIKDNMFEGCKELDYLIISENEISIDTHKLITKSKNNENSIAVIFNSIDQNINLAISCSLSDTFSKIEKKLFDEFPELKQQNIYYLANGNVIDKSLTLEKNKIKNSTTIIINYSN